MGELSVSDAEKERLLAEIGVEPTVMIRRREPDLPPPSPPPAPPPAPAPLPRLEAPAAVPRKPSWIGAHRQAIAAFLTLGVGSAWMAAWIASGRTGAAALAALGIAAGAWTALRPKKA